MTFKLRGSALKGSFLTKNFGDLGCMLLKAGNLGNFTTFASSLLGLKGNQLLFSSLEVILKLKMASHTISMTLFLRGKDRSRGKESFLTKDFGDLGCMLLKARNLGNFTTFTSSCLLGLKSNQLLFSLKVASLSSSMIGNSRVSSLKSQYRVKGSLMFSNAGHLRKQ